MTSGAPLALHAATMARLPSNSRKLLVASIGVASVSYVACGGATVQQQGGSSESSSTSFTETPVGNLAVPSSVSYTNQTTNTTYTTTGNYSTTYVTVGNLAPPPQLDAGRDAIADATTHDVTLTDAPADGPGDADDAPADAVGGD
jgi:hypothetical protein